ncbi:4110_t:CDS:1, partial [Gigaspora margarita]
MISKYLLKNNLQQLYLTHNGEFNFYTNYYTKGNQTIRVRKSLRILKKASPNYCVTRQYIKKQFLQTENNPNNESLKTRYIFKQNGIVNGDKINFSDDEMQLEMDDEQDNLPTEHDALKNFFGRW